MKLNLLPTHVSKEKVTRTALLMSILLFVVCILGAIGLYTKANADLADSQKDIPELRGEAQRATDVAAKADQVMQQSVTLLRNTQLAQAMLEHNKVYPALYNKVNRYIPAFFRVTSESAVPTGPGVSTVTLVGILDTYQQYADLMLALLRIPGVSSVSRTGFTNNNMIVPAPTQIDQYGKPRRPGDAPIPDDPLQRLEYFQSRGAVTAYQNQGGFGSGQPGLRGPMPNSSQVTVTLVIGEDLQTPDPRATLAAGGGSTTPGTGGGPGATGGQTPAPATGGGRRKMGSAGDDR
jgi:Tfp pilus assembly protein PilN